MKRIIIAIAILAVGGLSAGFLLRSRAGGDASYRFVQVGRGDIESTVDATGALSAVSTVQVGTQVSGQIAELYADFNDHVKKGQLIARLDPTLLQQAVEQAQADVQRAQADMDQKQYVLEQSKPLYASQSITETEYRTAQYNAAVSAASLKSAQSSLERAQQNLRYANIYAPIDGIVIERNVDVGQTVAASLSAPQLFLIAEDLSHMQILASVDESDIGQIKNGQPVRFTVQAYPNESFAGTVQQVRMQSTTTENVVNYTVVISVANPDGKLLPGMTATVAFEVAKAANVLKVPNAALRFRPTEAMQAAVQQARASAGADSTRRMAPDSATRAAWQARRAAGGMGSAGNGARPASSNVTQLWYLDANGNPTVLRVHTGLTDGQETEITGPNVKEGMKVIAGVVSGDAAPATTTSNPFQSQQPRGRRGPGGF